ncbi:hypothetical protein Emed_005151 [Eimeria media]
MTPPPSAQAVSLASSAVNLCMPLGDPEACRSLVMQDLQQLDDSVEFLIVGHRVKEDAAVSVGPPRLQYEAPGSLSPAHSGAAADSPQAQSQALFGDGAATGSAGGSCTLVSKNGVSFDWLVALGCLNCGAPVELRRDLVAAAEEAVAAATGENGEEVDASVSDKACLRCRYCGHVIAPLHTSDERESLVDRMQLKGEALPRLSSGGIYMFGSRKCYNFGSVGKQAWQQRFLGAEFEEQRLQHHLKIMLAAEEEFIRNLVQNVARGALTGGLAAATGALPLAPTPTAITPREMPQVTHTAGLKNALETNPFFKLAGLSMEIRELAAANPEALKGAGVYIVYAPKSEDEQDPKKKAVAQGVLDIAMGIDSPAGSGS